MSAGGIEMMEPHFAAPMADTEKTKTQGGDALNNALEEAYRMLKDGEFSTIDELDGAIEKYATLRGKSVLTAIYEKVNNDVDKKAGEEKQEKKKGDVDVNDNAGKRRLDSYEISVEVVDDNYFEDSEANVDKKDKDGSKENERSRGVKRISGGRNRLYYCSCDVMGKTLVGKSCTFRMRARKKRKENVWRFDVAAAESEGTLNHKSSCLAFPQVHTVGGILAVHGEMFRNHVSKNGSISTKQATSFMEKVPFALSKRNSTKMLRSDDETVHTGERNSKLHNSVTSKFVGKALKLL